MARAFVNGEENPTGSRIRDLPYGYARLTCRDAVDNPHAPAIGDLFVVVWTDGADSKRKVVSLNNPSLTYTDCHSWRLVPVTSCVIHIEV